MLPVCVKICGITRSEDACVAVDAGAIAVGMIFADQSPRHINVSTALEIATSLPTFINKVGLFMNAERNFVQSILTQVPINTLQFHGSENAAYCRQFNRPYIKAQGLKQPSFDADAFYREYSDAVGWLLDGHDDGEAGGSGQTLDWQALVARIDVLPKERCILAGGLNPDNVAQAVTQSGLRMLDVSSGVEKAPGIKDHDLIRRFVRRAQEASQI